MLKHRSIVLPCLLVMSAIVSAQEIKYTAGADRWDTETLGNHRAVIEVGQSARAAKAVRVIIPWRRRDDQPEGKLIIVVDSRTGSRVRNVRPGTITREAGEIIFEPVSGPGRYYVYYLPYVSGGRRNYPTVTYPKPERTADRSWIDSLAGLSNLPRARVLEFQSIDELNSFYPMEVIATAEETRRLIQNHPEKDFLVFPEDRMYPIRMTGDLPQRWIAAGPKNAFSGEAARGEYLAFQFGIYAVESIEDVRVKFTDLGSGGGRIIPARLLGCLNTNGIDWTGKPFTKMVKIDRGKVQAIWCGVDVPKAQSPGLYRGSAVISVKGRPAQTIALSIAVNNRLLADGGAGEPWKQTRLKWLNSTLAQRNEVIAPYRPLRVTGRSISLLGRKVVLGPDGLPRQIQSFFAPEMTSLTTTARGILERPIRFVARRGDGMNIDWRPAGLKFTQVQPGTVRWTARNESPDLRMDLEAQIEFDGFVDYRVRITALRDLSLSDLAMTMPLNPQAAKYLMGLGQKGGYRPEKIDWKWEVATRNQDGAWIGDVNAGLLFSLRAENYVRPLNTNFYLLKPLNLPPSWGNEGRGGIRIAEDNGSVVVDSYSSPRSMKRGETLHYNFTLLITPFHPLDTDFQWRTRFYHKYSPVDEIKATGATVVNIHHANAINPYINYPFIAHREMKSYIDEAHAKGLRVKIYNTVRELSNRAYETFALRSLGHEIYSSGKGGGFSWLQEHLGDDYIAAWFVPELKDAAIINSGMSRWHNYYVEGMNWLVRNVGIDGIYLDDVAFDRVTMKRIKRVLTQGGRPGIVDLHSANQFNKNDGFNNSAVLYLEHFPYLNRLWFGEYFDYENNSPDFYLTEISGIPFGLMGEMLEGGGNPWRGMLYGMTSRMPWSEKADPRPIWKVWDDFGIQGSRMIGYWVDNSPVRTNNQNVPATVYLKPGAALIAIASWAPEDVAVKLTIDWKALGIDPERASVTAPDIRNFQAPAKFGIDDEIPIAKGKGRLLILK